MQASHSRRVVSAVFDELNLMSTAGLVQVMKLAAAVVLLARLDGVAEGRNGPADRRLRRLAAMTTTPHRPARYGGPRCWLTASTARRRCGSFRSANQAMASVTFRACSIGR